MIALVGSRQQVGRRKPAEPASNTETLCPQLQEIDKIESCWFCEQLYHFSVE